MGMFHTLVIIGAMLLALCESRDITVSSSRCGGSYALYDDESLYLKYTGDALYSECKFTITASYFTKEICSSPQKFQINDCDTEIEYHDGYYSSFSADKTYSCGQTQYSSHCTSFDTLVVVFKGDGSRTTDNIELKIYEKDDDVVSNVVDTVKTTVYVIIGVIVGVIVLAIIVTIIVVFVCCRRRQSRPGQVFGGQQGGTVTTSTTYPMQNQAGYQPVQPVFQPIPQGGYQPPPSQGGYQPPPPQGGYNPQPGYQPGAYPPAPQQGYAGYQTAPDSNAPEKASAPPTGMEPPPYMPN